MNKKLLAMLLAVAMIASLAVVPAAAATKFPDAVGNWAESSIDRWADAGIVEGDTNGNINPSQFLTRAELATILVRLLGLTEKADAATFSDVAEGDWFADPVLKCAAAKIMLGDGEGHANPNDPITREQAITMVGRALGVKPQSGHSLERFVDADQVSAYAKEYMTPLTAMGILAGVGDGSRVAPQDTIDRASALALLDKAIAHYVTTSGTVKADNANAFVVVNVTDADASDVTVSGETAGVLVTTGNTADVKLKGLSADTVKVDAPVDVNVDGASKLGSMDVNAAANVTSKGVIGDLQLNDPAATSNVTTTPGGNTGTGGSYRPGRPSRKKNVEDAEVLFITNADEYKAFFNEDMPTDHNIQLPWLVVSYTRNVAGTVTFSITKDGETVQFGTVAEGAETATLTDTISSEFDASNENAYLSVHLYSQLNTDHKGQEWLNQTNAAGSYVATVELDGDESVSAAATYVDKTALTAAIADADAAAKAITVDTDAANVAEGTKWVTETDKKAYTDAIAAAQAVADKADATQADVDKAVTDLAAATEAFEAAKQDGTKPAPVPETRTLTFAVDTGAAIADLKEGTEAKTLTDNKLVVAKTSVVTFKVNVTDDTKEIDAVKVGETAIEAAEGVYTVAAADTDATVTVTLKAKPAPVPETRTLTFAVDAGAAIADLKEGAEAKTLTDNKLVVAKTSVVTFKVNVTDDTKEIDAVKVGETAIEAAEGVYTVAAADADATVTVTLETKPVEAVYTLTIPTGTFNGKADTDLMDGVAVAQVGETDTYSITGTSKYVTGYTGYSSVEAEQEGNYLVYKIGLPATFDKAAENASITVAVQDGNTTTFDNKTETAANRKLTAAVEGAEGAYFFAPIHRIGDKSKTVTVTVNPTGETADAKVFVLNLSGMTLEEKTVTPTPEVNKTALTNAITAAEADLAATVEDTDAANVAQGTKWALKADRDTYQTAIDAAQAVADNNEATQEQVDAAVTALETATNTFNSAKKDGTKTETPTPETVYVTAVAVKDAENGTSKTVTLGGTEATEIQLTATLTPSVEGETPTTDGVDWTVATADQGVSVDATGKVTVAADATAGTYTVTATAKSVKAADDETHVSGTYTVTVEAAAPVKVDLSTKTVTVSKDSAAVTTANVGDTLTAGIEGEDLTGHVTYQWKVGEDAIDGATEATFTVTAAQAGKTLTVTITANMDDEAYENAKTSEGVTVAAMKSTITYVPMTSTIYAASFGKLTAAPANVDDFGSIEITDNAITTGTLKYITGFTGFHGSDPAQQEGWYVPYMIEVPEGADKTKASLVGEKFEGGQTDKVLNPIGESEFLEDGGKTYLPLLVGVNSASVPKINIDWDGDGTAWTESELVSLTGLNTVTFTPGTVDEGTFVVANLGEEQNSGTTSTLATDYKVSAPGKVGYNAYEVTVSADTLTKHVSSDPVQADQGKQYYIGVGLPVVNTADHSLFASTDGGKTWMQVRVQKVTLGSTDYSMTYAVMSESKLTRVVEYKVTADKDNAGDPDGEISAKYTVTYKVNTLNEGTETNP